MATSSKSSPVIIPLLGHRWLRQSVHDPQRWAELVSAITPMRICEPLQASGPFRNDSAILCIGEVVMLATEGSAITLATEHHPFAQLLLPYRGLGLWQVERSRLENPMGESVLYLPPAPLRLVNDITSGVSLNLNVEALLRTALTMAGPEGLTQKRLAVFQEPRRLLVRDPLAAPLIRQLYGLMATIDARAHRPDAIQNPQQLEDSLLRLIVALLLPELRQDQSGSMAPLPSASDRRKIETLLDWIEANLEAPIRLSDLEARVFWSRRTLLDAFRSTCGCGPMQWVRRRRLQRSLRRISNPLPGDTLTAIGLSVGFSSDVAFRREFHRQYGCSPSALFRS
jgi:AraC-like DNA-binding protein